MAIEDQATSDRVTTPAEEARAVLRRETTVSIIINMLFSLVFTWIVFGSAVSTPKQDVLIDFVPQSFMVALMGGLIPSFLTRKHRIAGWAATMPTGAAALPRNLLLRSLVIALLATLVIGGAAALVAALLLDENVEYVTLLLFKPIYGGCLAALVTPFALKASWAKRDLEKS